MYDKRKPFKAIMSGIIAGLSTAAVAATDEKFTSSEIILILSAVAISVGAVYGVKNPKV